MSMVERTENVYHRDDPDAGGRHERRPAPTPTWMLEIDPEDLEQRDPDAG